MAKIEELLKKKSKLLPGQLKYEERKADEHVSFPLVHVFSKARDLTSTRLHCFKVKGI